MPSVKTKAIGAVVLAAGASARMGKPKQLLKVGGMSMVRRTARAALEAGCQPVIVVTGSGSAGVERELMGLPVQKEFNATWARGVGTSVRAGVAALAKTPVDGVVILVCDQPHLSEEIIKQLIADFAEGENPMAACEYSDTMGPPCCFDRSMFPELMRLAEDQGAKRLLQNKPQQVTLVAWPSGSVDLDTPGDFEAAVKNPPGR